MEISSIESSIEKTEESADEEYEDLQDESDSVQQKASLLFWSKGYSFQDLQISNLSFMRGLLYSTPYHGGPLDPESFAIFDLLWKMNVGGLITIDSEPFSEFVSPHNSRFRLRQVPYVQFYCVSGIAKELVERIIKQDPKNITAYLIDFRNEKVINYNRRITKDRDVVQSSFEGGPWVEGNLGDNKSTGHRWEEMKWGEYTQDLVNELGPNYVPLVKNHLSLVHITSLDYSNRLFEYILSTLKQIRFIAPKMQKTDEIKEIIETSTEKHLSELKTRPSENIDILLVSEDHVMVNDMIKCLFESIRIKNSVATLVQQLENNTAFLYKVAAKIGETRPKIIIDNSLLRFKDADLVIVSNWLNKNIAHNLYHFLQQYKVSAVLTETNTASSVQIVAMESAQTETLVLQWNEYTLINNPERFGKLCLFLAQFFSQ